MIFWAEIVLFIQHESCCWKGKVYATGELIIFWPHKEWVWMDWASLEWNWENVNVFEWVSIASNTPLNVIDCMWITLSECDHPLSLIECHECLWVSIHYLWVQLHMFKCLWVSIEKGFNAYPYLTYIELREMSCGINLDI